MTRPCIHCEAPVECDPDWNPAWAVICAVCLRNLIRHRMRVREGCQRD
jgi:hypothetical protein